MTLQDYPSWSSVSNILFFQQKCKWLNFRTELVLLFHFEKCVLRVSLDMSFTTGKRWRRWHVLATLWARVFGVSASLQTQLSTGKFTTDLFPYRLETSYEEAIWFITLHQKSKKKPTKLNLDNFKVAEGYCPKASTDMVLSFYFEL